MENTQTSFVSTVSTKIVYNETQKDSYEKAIEQLIKEGWVETDILRSEAELPSGINVITRYFTRTWK